MVFGESAFIIGASLTAINVAFIVITAIAARTIGLGVAEIDILSGPTLFSFRVGEMTVVVKPIPIGSGIRFREHGTANECKAPSTEPFRSLSDLSCCQQMALALSTPISFLLAAFALVGGSIGHHVATALPEIYVGALRPTTVGVDLLKHYVEAWHAAPLVALGLLAAKYGVYLLMPTAGSPGFVAAAVILKKIFDYDMSSDFNRVAAMFLFIPPMVVLGGWTVATFWFLYPLLDSAI